jgi:hypothetical protein
MWSEPPLEPASIPYVEAQLLSLPPSARQAGGLLQGDPSAARSEPYSLQIQHGDLLPIEILDDAHPVHLRHTPTAALQGSPQARVRPRPPSPPPFPLELGEDYEQLRDLFERFIAMKARYEEPVEDLSLEAFVFQLRAARDQYVAAHGWSALKFSVHYKRGRVALRARPVELSPAP